MKKTDPWKRCEMVKADADCDLSPRIRKRTLRLLAKVHDGSFTPAGRKALTECRKIARDCLERFQRRCKTPLQLGTYAGTYLMDAGDRERTFTELNSALDYLNNPLCPGLINRDAKNRYGVAGGCVPSVPAWNFERRVLKRFPELCELWWISYELDSAPGRPDLNTMTTRSKPFKPKNNVHPNHK